MAKETVKKLRLSTPKGVLKFPKLTEPDHGTEAYPCGHKWGDYKTKMILDRADKGVEEFLAKLDAAFEEAKGIAEEELAEWPVKKRKELEAKGGISPDFPYSEIYDEATEEPTGQVELNFKMKAGGESKKDGKEWLKKPALFDAKGRPLPTKTVVIKGKKEARTIDVWSGSTAIINFEVSPYFMPTGKYGISRRLNAAQIIDLVAAGGGMSAAGYGFTAQDGFDGTAYAAEEAADEDQEGAEDGDEDGDEDPNF